MPNVNRIHIEGHLGKQPELRYSQNQTAFCNGTIAVSEYRKNGDKWETTHTEWFRVTVWGKEAEKFAQFDKGDTICIPDGKIKTRSWEDEKTGQKRYSTEVNAFSFYGKKKSRYEQASNQNPNLPLGMDDIPF